MLRQKTGINMLKQEIKEKEISLEIIINDINKDREWELINRFNKLRKKMYSNEKLEY